MSVDLDSAPVIYPETYEQLFVLAIVLACADTAVLILRIWSRALLPGKKFGADDWMAIAAWPFGIGINIQTCLGMRHGFGIHVEKILETSPGDTTYSLRVLFAGYLTYTFAISFIRISAGLFYRRVISDASRRFHWAVHLNTALNLIWLAGLILSTLLGCHPISSLSAPKKPGYCVPMNVGFASGVPSVILDLFVLIMPMPVLWKLQMTRTRKMLLLLIFALGYSVIIPSIGRLITTIFLADGLSTDVTWYLPKVLIWFNIELALASICLSLPSLMFFVRRAHQGGFKALLSSRSLSLPGYANARNGKPQPIQLADRSLTRLHIETNDGGVAVADDGSITENVMNAADLEAHS